MDSFHYNTLQMLENGGKVSQRRGYQDSEDRDKDGQDHLSLLSPPDTSTSTNARRNLLSCLPTEVLLYIFGYLTISQMLPCQLVSRRLRALSRSALMDRLGGQWLQGCQPIQQLHCSPCRPSRWQHRRCRVGELRGGKKQGLPPLPHNHRQIGHCHDGSLDQESNLQHQHQEHLEHLYQDQSVSHSETDSYHHSTFGNNTQPTSSSSGPTSSVLSQHQYCSQSKYQPCFQDSDHVAPGDVALYLFPHHDHTPSGWQKRQSVHFRCTGIDRHKEQLIFSPIYPETGDRIKFSTNSWSLPCMPSTRESSSSNSIAVGCGYKSPATGLDLFDYATGQPRYRSSNQVSTDQMGQDLGSYSFTDQFGFSGSSSLPSRRRSVPSPWSVVNGSGSEYYSVIGIKHGDWPEDHKALSRWWWWDGGVESRIAQQPMVFLPWSASAGGQGTVADFQRRLLRQQEQELQDREASIGNGKSDRDPCDRPPLYKQPITTLGYDPDSGSSDDGDLGIGCSRIHKHHQLCVSSDRPSLTSHHHRYFCLHHDQLMADIAAFNAFKASTRIGADLETLDPTPDTPMATAGTRHLSIDYSAMVGESKRCQFCLSTPCKANLEIQVKFDKVRVSLDWVLSGFVPEFKQQDHSRRPGQVHVA